MGKQSKSLLATEAQNAGEGTNSTLRAHGLTALARLTNIALVAFSAVFFARILGPENYGILTTALSAATILAVVSEQGLSNWIAREVASSTAAGDYRSVWSHFACARVNFLVVNVIMACVALVLLSSSVPNIRNACIGMLLAISIGGTNVIAGFLRGQSRPAAAMVVGGIVRPLIVIGLGLVALAMVGSVSLDLMLWLSVVAGLIALILSYLWCVDGGPRNIGAHRKSAKWVPIQFSFIILGSLQAGSGNLEPLLLSIVSDADQVSYFRISFLLAFFCQAPAGIVSAVVLPKIASYWTAGEMRALQVSARQAAAWAFLFTTPIALCMAATLSVTIPLLFGKEFAGSSLPSAALLIMMLPYSLLGLSGTVLAMTGGERSAIACTMLGYLLTAATIVALGPALGAMGAVIGSALGLITQNLAMHLFIRFRVGRWCIPSLHDLTDVVRAVIRVLPALMTSVLRRSQWRI